MKLASLKEGGRDGTLIVVDRELTLAVRATNVAPTLQKALDNWTTKATVVFKVNSNGVVTKTSSTLSGDVCKG